MKVQFVHYIYPEDFNFTRIVRNAGHSHEIDVEAFEDKFWNHGESRELAVTLELDTETGNISVVGQ
jgi:antirestriction protein